MFLLSFLNLRGPAGPKIQVPYINADPVLRSCPPKSKNQNLLTKSLLYMWLDKNMFQNVSNYQGQFHWWWINNCFKHIWNRATLFCCCFSFFNQKDDSVRPLSFEEEKLFAALCSQLPTLCINFNITLPEYLALLRGGGWGMERHLFSSPWKPDTSTQVNVNEIFH